MKLRPKANKHLILQVHSCREPSTQVLYNYYKNNRYKLINIILKHHAKLIMRNDLP